MYCVYMHKNLINGKVYIGVTNDIKRRWRQNGVEYKKSKSFYGAIKKYGFNSFSHTVLEDNLEKEKAFELEKYYISLYHSNDKRYGYNISEGGNGGKVYKKHPRNMIGKHQTDYQKEHQSEIMKNSDFNPMKNGSCIWGVTHSHPRGFKGGRHSEDEKMRISETLKKNKINCKSIKVIYPNGKIEIYSSMTEAQNSIGLTTPVILKIIRSKKPYEVKIKNQYSERVEHLTGIRIEYSDNTEITN